MIMTGLTPRMRRAGWREARFDEMMDIDEEGKRYIDNTFTIARALFQATCLALVGPTSNNLGCFRLTITSQTYSLTTPTVICQH